MAALIISCFSDTLSQTCLCEAFCPRTKPLRPGNTDLLILHESWNGSMAGNTARNRRIFPNSSVSLVLPVTAAYASVRCPAKLRISVSIACGFRKVSKFGIYNV